MVCPNCGYSNQANNRFCVRCGVDISVPPPPETPSFDTGQPTGAAPAGPAPPPSDPPAPPNPWGTPHAPAPSGPGPYPPPGPYSPPGPPAPAGYPPPPPGAPSNPFAPPHPYGPPANPYAPPGQYAPYPAPYPQSAYVPQSTNGLAIAALILGLVGWIPCGIGSIAAVVLGFVARNQIRQSQGRQGGDGLALAGIILGFVAIAFWVLVVVWGAVTGAGSSSN